MSEKSLRGASPGGDQAGASSVPAAPSAAAASSGERSSDTGGAPVEPWGGERTDRVSSRETSAPRVALVPAATADGQVDAPTSAADTTRRVADSGRTTLMGVPSPVAPQADKPTTSPGHDVHLPAEKGRQADARPAGGGGTTPAVEPDPSSARRVGKVESPGRSSGEQHSGARSEKSERKDDKGSKHSKDDKDSKAGGSVPNERSMAAAAATFRASAGGSDQQPADDQASEPEQQRSWTADRTQEFHLDTPPPRSGFGKALATGMALAVGTGILVVSFVHSRVHGTAESNDLAHATAPLPVAPVPLPPPRPPENPVPPVAVDQTNGQPNPAADDVAPAVPDAPVAAPEPAPPATGIAEDLDQAKTDRRGVQRGKTPAPAGRASPPARTARAAPAFVRPAPPLPGAAAPAATAPTVPPPLTATPPPDKPPASRPETGKPYDPDMPLPPSTE